jgi:Serine carboxypeptidase
LLISHVTSDQPVQTGFSYDSLLNATYDVLKEELSQYPPEKVPEQTTTFLVGTFPSQDPALTTNGTANSARAFWHFAQVFFQEFPDYKPNDDRVSIWAESYGGHYGPAFAAFFQEQNQKIANGTWNETGNAYTIHLDTLGIINGCVDDLTQMEAYPEFAYNNTYDIQTIDSTLYKSTLNAWSKKGGCRDQLIQCRNLSSQYDPTNQENNPDATAACVSANDYCEQKVILPYLSTSSRDFYDIAANATDSFPPFYMLGFLSQPWVQAALGVPLNFTTSSLSVYHAFHLTGDGATGGFLEDLAYLLDSGVKVAMVYGDRDYACNWVGAERVSLAVPYSGQKAFAAAGYTDIQVNSSYIGGKVRQYGNFSFSRVYQAGHQVPSYQPETSFQIFTRAMNNLDIATGNTSTAAAGGKSYSTTGPSDTWSTKNKVLPQSPHQCYVLKPSTCTTDEQQALLDGSAVVKNYILQGNMSNGGGESGGSSGGSGGKPKSGSSRVDLRWSWSALAFALLVFALL